jgi:hypothetical protein
MLLDRGGVAEEPVVVLTFPILLQLLINFSRNMALKRKGMEIAHVLAVSCGEILLEDSCWALLKG